MVESLSISKVATYGGIPEILFRLSKINSIFDLNGTGKATISRVFTEPDGYENCIIICEQFVLEIGSENILQVNAQSIFLSLFWLVISAR